MNEQTELARELEIALHAVSLAARACCAVRDEAGAGGAIQKEDKSPVTVADFASQALVCRALVEAFPDLPIVAEEGTEALRSDENRSAMAGVTRHVGAVLGHEVERERVLEWIDLGCGQPRPDGRFWTLDPIDGTRGFLRGDSYAISLALLERGELVVGALACPGLAHPSLGPGGGVVYAAVRGQGARVHSLDPFDAGRPVRVDPASDPRQARLVESVEAAHSDHDWAGRIARHLGISTEPVRVDSQAKYGIVADGRANVYLRLPTRADYREKIWDHGAGALVTAEAGGRVTDIDGRPLDFTKGERLENNRGVVATNGALHDAVLEAIRSSQ